MVSPWLRTRDRLHAYSTPALPEHIVNYPLRASFSVCRKIDKFSDCVSSSSQFRCVRVLRNGASFSRSTQPTVAAVSVLTVRH